MVKGGERSFRLEQREVILERSAKRVFSSPGEPKFPVERAGERCPALPALSSQRRGGVLLQPQQRFDPLLVEPDNRLAVDDGDRDLLSSEIFQLLKRLHVLADVLFDEGDAFLRKKLFLPVAAPSPRAGIDHDRFGHLHESSS